MQLYNGYSNFVPKNTASQVLHSGRGFIHTIIASVDGAAGGTNGTLTIYDNTAASGNILFRVHPYLNNPVFIELERTHVLKFLTGLTVVTSAYVDAFILSEA